MMGLDIVIHVKHCLCFKTTPEQEADQGTTVELPGSTDQEITVEVATELSPEVPGPTEETTRDEGGTYEPAEDKT